MEAGEKQALTLINKIPLFKEVIQKLTTNVELSEYEKTYILGCSIIFLKYYESDKRFTSYAEFSYFIILKYSITYNDYFPLYDYSTSFGFYPIVRSIIQHNLTGLNTIGDFCLDIELEKFQNDAYIETIHQFNGKRGLLEDATNEMTYIAPTSFGKSAVIIDCIKKYSEGSVKIGIVVPTKSLLMQTYRMIREANLNKKIIIHDEMYQGEESFIAIFTQERALRLLAKHQQLFYDVLFIDEAHNMLKDDSRSILLSRLLSKNRVLNPQQKIIYLSPLIDDVNSLKIASDQNITQHKIPFNIKEPEIFEFKLDKKIFQYNRFVGEHYFRGESDNIFTYIMSTSAQKNFLYNYRPVNIEYLAKDLSRYIRPTNITEALADLIKILKQEVHEKFYAIDYITHGIIYLHGKLPDLIKEYLESKFRDLAEIKYIIANSVILEGMNLPIDNLYVLNTRKLYGKELTNLIGRVNRLNTIFTSQNSNLSKLLPQVHFLNNEKYNRKDSNMTLKIELLRSRGFKDLIQNPTLERFDFENLKINKDQKENAKLKCETIQENEKYLSLLPKDAKERLKKYLIEAGIHEFYKNVNKLTETLFIKIESIKLSVEWDNLDMLEKINELFLSDLENVKDFEFLRLSNPQARKYYDFHITVSQKKALKENIIYMFEYFKQRVIDNNSKFYFGETYGEEVRNVNSDEREVYIDLSKKTDVELINLAIVKLKMEDDFVSFKLNKAIVMMYDFNLITQDAYNTYIYGTTDQNKIDLTKIGLSVSLITRLEKDQQLQNIYFDSFNNLKYRPAFENYKSQANDFYRFEINRFLS